MIVRHPIRQRRRHQEHLPAVTRNEVLRHKQKCLIPPGRHPVKPTASVWTVLGAVEQIDLDGSMGLSRERAGSRGV